MRTVQLEKLRPDEILEEKKRTSIVYLPLGPLEWHGPAMPYGTDPLAAEAIARRSAEITGGVVMPTVYLGTERERSPEMLDALGFEDTSQYIVGQDFPANSMKSYYSKEEVFSLVVREYLRMLVQQEYRLIVIVNGHGAANQAYALERLAVEFSNETASQVIVIMPLVQLDESDQDLGHATRQETAIQMALAPENVDLSKLPPKTVKLKNSEWGIDDGCTFALQPNKDKTVIYDPRDATEELGRKYIAKGVEAVTDQVSKKWSELSGKKNR